MAYVTHCKLMVVAYIYIYNFERNLIENALMKKVHALFTKNTTQKIRKMDDFQKLSVDIMLYHNYFKN